MNFLVVSSIFPPDAIGGAELSAYNCARWLCDEGHNVSVLTTAKSREEELRGIEVDGMKMWRFYWPRPYSVHAHNSQSITRKVLWHLQDHFDPRNSRILAHVIREVQPDFVNFHLVSGIGHNALSALDSLPNVRVLYFLHDLGLACIRSCMYKNESNCSRKCHLCQISSFLKFRHIRRQEIFHFISPSASNLDTLVAFTPLKRFHASVVPNLDLEIAIPRENGNANGPLRFIYVGRLHQTKGIEFLLSVFEQIARERDNFHLTIVGGGPIEANLRALYQHYPWATFTGRIPPSDVRAKIKDADVLCVPSLLRENHPGVVRKALRAGVPAIISDMGGIAEMIEDGHCGMVLPAADAIEWNAALISLIDNPPVVEALQAGALATSRKYAVQTVSAQLKAVITAALPSQARVA